MEKSCVCNNMCYSEGTVDEIITIDGTTEDGCTCYNTSYSKGLEDQARLLTFEERENYLNKNIKTQKTNILSKEDGVNIMLSLIESIKRLETVSNELVTLLKEKK